MFDADAKIWTLGGANLVHKDARNQKRETGKANKCDHW